MITITNPRGVRAAWPDGLFDFVCMGAHTLGGSYIAQADRSLLVVRALKRWPDTPLVEMVDRVMMVLDTIETGGRTALAMLADRHIDTLVVETLFWPVICASTLRPLNAAELTRLQEAIKAAGIEPSVFGLDNGGG